MRPSKAISDACLDVADELAAQPSLFDSNLLPIDVPVFRAAKRICSTGQLATRDDATALAIAACKLAGLSDRETGRRVGVSHHTVGGVMRLLEASGRIPSAHERLACRLGEVAESATSEIARLIQDADGKWSTDEASAIRALGVVVGITVDKQQLLTGQATAIIEQRVGAPTSDSVKEWEDKLRQLFGPVIELEQPSSDSESAGLSHKCLTDKADPLIATGLAASRAPSAVADQVHAGSTPDSGGGS